jgi:hypothetical protein
MARAATEHLQNLGIEVDPSVTMTRGAALKKSLMLPIVSTPANPPPATTKVSKAS